MKNSFTDVEIIKIGNIIGPNSFPFHNKGDNKIILVATDGDSIYNYYLNLLITNKPDYKYQKTQQAIVGYPYNLFNHKVKKIFGKPDSVPIIGQSYTLDNSKWHTSKVEDVVTDCVIITKNSIYAIHDISKIRAKKITDLGL